MIQDEMARMLAERLFAPRQLLFCAGVLVYTVAVGYASRSLLLRRPDFPYRREMLRGTWWMPAMVAVALGLAMAITYFGAVYSSFPLTSIVLGGAVSFAGISYATSLRPMRVEGWLFCLTASGARLRGQPLDLDEWVTKRVRQYHGPLIKYGIGGVLPLLVILMNGYLALAFTYPFDRDLSQADRDQRIADQVAADAGARLRSDAVIEIEAYGPPDLDSMKQAGSAAQAWRSLREILALDRPSPAREPFHLFIAVTPETSAEDAADMLEQARTALVEGDVAGRWEISIYVPKSKTLAQGEYP